MFLKVELESLYRDVKTRINYTNLRTANIHTYRFIKWHVEQDVSQMNALWSSFLRNYEREKNMIVIFVSGNLLITYYILHYYTYKYI